MTNTPVQTTQQRLVSTPLVGISLAYFMVLLDITVLAVAEPDMITSLGTDVVGVAWATTSYTITLAASLVLAGARSDRFGPARVFRTGIVAFGVLSLACALSPAIGVLIAVRALLGVAAAAVIPSSMALIARLYDDKKLRAKAVSVWAAVSGAAMAAGPVVGGLLVGEFGWRAVFLVNVPITLFVVLLTVSPWLAGTGHQRKIDPLPHALLALSLAAVTFSITEAGQLHWGRCIVAGIVAVLLLVLLAGRDRRSASPIIPAALRGNGPAWGTFSWGAATNYVLTAILFTLPLTLHKSPVAAGLTLLPMTLLMAFNPVLTGKIVARSGPALPIRMGLTALVIGCGLLVVGFYGGQHTLLIVLGLLMCGLGTSWTLPALVAFAVNHVSQDAAGAVGGILNATRQMGATIGAAAASALLTIWPHGVGAQLALGLGAGLALVSVFSTFVAKN